MVSMGIFIIQYLLYKKVKIDAAYVVGFCLYFDMFGYFYKLAMPGNALFLLIAVPLIPVVIAWFSKDRKAREILSDGGIWLWFIVLLYGIVSLAWTTYGSAGLSKEAILIIHAIIPGIYAYILYKKYGKFSWKTLALFGLIFALVHLLLGEYSPEYPGRLSLPGSNPILNARMSLITITVCLWRREIPLYIRIITITAATVSALATQSRGPIVAFVIANLIVLVFFIYKRYKHGEFKHLSKYVVISIFILLAGVITASQYSREIDQWVGGSRFGVFFDRAELQGDNNFIGRLDLQRKAIDKWTDHPFFGGGLGSVTPPIARDFPHNVVLEIASEMGVVGLLLWSFAYLYSIWVSRRNGLLLALLFQTLGTALISGDFGFNFEYVLISIVALALIPNNKRVGEESHAQGIISNYKF
ncbi:O-antigen ligase family protein [Paenibacillus segetis]|nr:O-antigen ligase family protein [Paenibacillus segetis]